LKCQFFKHLNEETLEALFAFARHPSRTLPDIQAWLADRGHPAERAQLSRWWTEFKEQEAQRQLDAAVKHQSALYLSEQGRFLGGARMLRDDEAITPEIRAEIARRFADLIATMGRSQAWAARSLDMKPTTLSESLSGSYKGDIDTYIRRIDKWIDQQYGKLKAGKPDGWVKTSTALAIIKLAKIATEQNGICVAYGPSGCGKTITAKYLASEYPGAIYIEITEGNKRPTAILEAIARELRIGQIKMTVAKLEQHVVEVLRGTGRLIIVDEVHALIAGRSKEEQTLHMLRRLQDQTECPMLWFGTIDFARYVEDGAGIRQGVDQLMGRIVYWLDMATPVLNKDDGPGHHSVEDIREMVKRHQLRLTSEAEEFLKDMANAKGLGGLRAVDMLLALVAGKVKNKQIDIGEPLLRDAMEQRLGRAAWRRADTKIEEYRKRLA
jgi:DNA transposition AAA+ family ATPase